MNCTNNSNKLYIYCWIVFLNYWSECKYNLSNFLFVYLEAEMLYENQLILLIIWKGMNLSKLNKLDDCAVNLGFGVEMATDIGYNRFHTRLSQLYPHISGYMALHLPFPILLQSRIVTCVRFTPQFPSLSASKIGRTVS